MTSYNRTRMVLGFLLGPLMPGVAASILTFFAGGAYWETGVALYMGLSATIGYPVAFLFGLPLYFIMQRYGTVRLHHYIIAGLILGVLATFLAFIDKFQYFSLAQFVQEYLSFKRVGLGAIMGSIATSSFWFIVRPDTFYNTKKLKAHS